MNTDRHANGLEFAYLTDGPEDGPLALCLHGFPDTAHTWRYLLPELAAAGFRAVAPFLRGYAPTAIPADGRYQVGALVRDANALHEALGGGDDAVLDRPRLGRPGHLRRRGPPTRPLAPGRHGRRPPHGVHRHVALHLRAAAEELVHVLLPVPDGRDGAPPGRLHLHRPPLARLVTGYDGTWDVARVQGVHRRPRAHRGGHRVLPRHVGPRSAGARTGRRASGGTDADTQANAVSPRPRRRLHAAVLHRIPARLHGRRLGVGDRRRRRPLPARGAARGRQPPDPRLPDDVRAPSPVSR